MARPTYQHLLEPFQLKHLQLKNRIVKTAQWLIYPEPDGSVGERLLAFYETLAAGGVGLITVEESICDYPLGASNVPHIRLDDDRFLPGLTRLAEVIQQHDVPAIVQITHAGPAHNPQQPDGGQPVAPSAIDPPTEPSFAVARELALDEITELVEKYAQAALRCRRAGFQGVEIHMAHYALVNAFLSRIQNKRHDRYGCDSLENRARFSVEILRRVRELCGPDFVVGVRMNGKEWGHPLGTTSAEAAAFAQMFEGAGADYIQVSAYGYGEFWMCAFPDHITYPEVTDTTRDFVQRIPDGALIPEAAHIKQAVSIPVSGVGKLTLDTADELLAEGVVDLACFGRYLLADPELPNKLHAGQAADVRPCLGCLHCLHVLFTNQPVECRINPFLGHEADMALAPAAAAKRVLVVGAGPAGLEAARVAALRGHQVMLYDKVRALGGLMPMAAFIKGAVPDDLQPALDWYERQLKQLGVEIRLGREVTVDLVQQLQPDVVIVAPGGVPQEPAIPTVNGHNLVTTEALKKRAQGFVRVLGPRQLNQLTRIFLPTGKRVVVVGGDLAAMETVEFLVKRGKEVTMVTEAPQIGQGALIPWLVRYLPWLAAREIPVYTGVTMKSLAEDGLRIVTDAGEEMFLPADTVMVVTQYARNDALFQALEGVVAERYLIGDGAREAPAYIAGAIRSGAETALVV